MDIQKHFNGYRALLRADAFRNYTDIAQSVSTDGNPFPTLYDVIISCKKDIDASIKANDLATYKRVLPKHQQSFIQLFETIVERELQGRGKTESVFMDLIAENLNWFKFSKGSITFGKPNGKKFYYVPRLTALTPESKHWGAVCFDADEIKLINAVTKMSKKRGDKLMVEKYDGNNLLKLMEIRTRKFLFRDVHRLNVEDRVSDWTGSLFNEERERF